MALQSVNPHNNKVIKNYTADSWQQTEKKLLSAQKSFAEWKDSAFSERSTLLKKTASLLGEHKHQLAKLMAEEMGKPLAQGIAEAEKCAWVCEYYAANAKSMLQDEHIETNFSRSYVSFRPLGTILAIMPWNYPLWQVFRALAPNIMAGNTLVLKHAGNVTGCALAIKELMQKAGAGKGVFDILLTESKGVNQIIEHEAIAAVTLTGSTNAGKAVAAKAGSVLKKCVLELGGSDPYIILKDADIEDAAKQCVESRLKNGGQSCISAKRFIVDKSIAKPFTDAFIELMKQQVAGNPKHANTTLGPMARTDLRNELHQQVLRSIASGAKLKWGGAVSDINGAYYPCSVLTNVTPGMKAFDEELFGPVAAIIKAKDENEAVALANQSIFGLGSAVFSSSLKKAEKIARNLVDAGSVFINTGVNSDPRLPFGGIKESGYGRELGLWGIREFVNVKTVVVK